MAKKFAWDRKKKQKFGFPWIKRGDFQTCCYFISKWMMIATKTYLSCTNTTTINLIVLSSLYYSCCWNKLVSKSPFTHTKIRSFLLLKWNRIMTKLAKLWKSGATMKLNSICFCSDWIVLQEKERKNNNHSEHSLFIRHPQIWDCFDFYHFPNVEAWDPPRLSATGRFEWVSQPAYAL